MVMFPTHEPRGYVPITDCPDCDGTSWETVWRAEYGQYVGVPCKTCGGTGEVKVAAERKIEEAA